MKFFQSRSLVTKVVIIMLAVYVIFTCLLFVLYHPLEMVDASFDPVYASMIGKKFRVKKDVLALGVSMETTPRLPPDIVILIDRKNEWLGREVVCRSRIEEGTVIQVVKVWRYTSFVAKVLPDHGPEYEVKEVGTSQITQAPIRVKSVGEGYDRTVGLDSKVCELIPSE